MSRALLTGGYNALLGIHVPRDRDYCWLAGFWCNCICRCRNCKNTFLALSDLLHCQFTYASSAKSVTLFGRRDKNQTGAQVGLRKMQKLVMDLRPELLNHVNDHAEASLRASIGQCEEGDIAASGKPKRGSCTGRVITSEIRNIQRSATLSIVSKKGIKQHVARTMQESVLAAYDV